MITQSRLKELLNYDAELGFFVWVAKRKGSPGVGKRAGYVQKSTGYRYLNLEGRMYEEHRLAWLFVHGRWPVDCIDHVNGIRDDNRFVNLREATRGLNSANMKLRRFGKKHSRFKGVTFATHANRWKAQLDAKHLGYFTSEKDAHMAYCAAASAKYGEFANFGAT